MRRGLRWLAPAASGGVVAAYALVPVLLAGHVEHPALPALTAQTLLARVQHADVAGLSGTVRETAGLGLPSLPDGEGGSALALLSGSHTLRVDRAGTDRLRVAVLGQLEEQDLVVGPRGAWTYDSTTGHASRLAAPRSSAAAATPQGSAADALAAIDPTTAVTVDRTARVAGRDAYTLVLTPRQQGSLVARVEIAVDAVTGEPLRTRVYAAGRNAPAFEAAYTSIRYAVPSAATFDPPDAPTTPGTSSTGGGLAGLIGLTSGRTTTIGSGWTAITRITGLRLTADQRAQLATLSDPVPAGRLVRTALLSLLVTPTGTAYVGAVPGQALETLAAAGS